MSATDQDLIAAGSIIRRRTMCKARLAELKRSYDIERSMLETELATVEHAAAELIAATGPITTVYGRIGWRKAVTTVVDDPTALADWASDHFGEAVSVTTSPTALVAHGCKWHGGQLVTPDGEPVPGVRQEYAQAVKVEAGRNAPVEADDVFEAAA